MGWFLLHGNMNQPNTLTGDSLEAGKAAWGVWDSRSTLLDASSRAGGSVASNLPAAQGAWVRSLVGKSSWKTEWQPTPLLLPGESSWQKSLVGYSPWGRKESDLTEWLHQQCAHVKPCLPASPSPPPLWEPQAWFLHLGLHLCFVHKFIYTVFLHSTYMWCHMIFLLLWLCSLSMTVSRSNISIL